METQRTRESSVSEVWSEESQVYYYSTFELFEDQENETQFYQYSIFIETVTNELGQEWHRESNMLFFPIFNSHEVFMNLLQVWLHHHNLAVNTQNTRNKITFSQLYVEQFLEKMFADLEIRHPGYKIVPLSTSVKAVCMGFFMTSDQIWEEMFTEKPEKPTCLFSANSLMKEVASTIEFTFKPLMVVTEKISNVFGRKRRKVNEEEEGDIANEGCQQIKFEDCYHEFRKTLGMEKMLEQKMSEIFLQDNFVQQGRKIVQKKAFEEAESPFHSYVISKVYRYVTEFLHRNHSWQVASNFVTNVLDLNTMQIDEGLKIKVLRPAEDFYQKLVIVWLLFKKDQKKQTMTFQMYLSRLKSTYLSREWKEKYIVPVKYFYDKMTNNWAEIQLENPKASEKEILQAFIRKIKSSMKTDWDRKINLQPKSKSQGVNV